MQYICRYRKEEKKSANLAKLWVVNTILFKPHEFLNLQFRAVQKLFEAFNITSQSMPKSAKDNWGLIYSIWLSLLVFPFRDSSSLVLPKPATGILFSCQRRHFFFPSPQIS